jgi:hypothetical protein
MVQPVTLRQETKTLCQTGISPLYPDRFLPSGNLNKEIGITILSSLDQYASSPR